MVKLTDITIIITSSKDYSDLWPVFCYFWKLNFPEHTGRLVFVSNSEPQTQISGFELHISEGDWSTRLLSVFEKVDEEYILLLTEDIILSKKVNFAYTQELLDETFSKNWVDYLRLAPFPPPLPGRKIEKLAPGALHRVSLQPSIWSKQVLISLLKAGETPHDFETFGTLRSRDFTQFFCSQTSLVDYLEIIGRGKLTRKGYKYLKENYPFNQLSRKRYTMVEEMDRDLHHFKAKVNWITRGMLYTLRSHFFGS